MNDYMRLRDNIRILDEHNKTSLPVLKLTGGKKYEKTIINEIVEDVTSILRKVETCYLIEFPCKVGDKVYQIVHEYIPEEKHFIVECEVTDLSVKGIEYGIEHGGGFVPWNMVRDLYMNKRDAEIELKVRNFYVPFNLAQYYRKRGVINESTRLD